jgi:hypothetical protein
MVGGKLVVNGPEVGLMFQELERFTADRFADRLREKQKGKPT